MERELQLEGVEPGWAVGIPVEHPAIQLSGDLFVPAAAHVSGGLFEEIEEPRIFALRSREPVVERQYDGGVGERIGAGAQRFQREADLVRGGFGIQRFQERSQIAGDVAKAAAQGDSR